MNDDSVPVQERYALMHRAADKHQVCYVMYGRLGHRARRLRYSCGNKMMAMFIVYARYVFMFPLLRSFLEFASMVLASTFAVILLNAFLFLAASY